MVGMSLVDMQCVYRSEKNVQNKVLRGQVINEDVTVIKFSGLLPGKIRLRDRHMTAVL
jgi:hypothetical protein